MPSIWSDTNKVEELFLKHTDKVKECLDVFFDLIKMYIEQGKSKQVLELSEQVHSLETEADNIRREIIHLLIGKSFLLPNTRRDFLSLLECIDKVADYSEAITDYIFLQDMDISSIGKSKLEEIFIITEKQFKLLQRAVGFLFKDINRAFELVLEIDQLESEVDVIERLLISRLTKERPDLDLCTKILYRDFINMVANISDKIEDAGDEIEIIIAMRKV
ncbi:MAG: TIGR00153 family protein [Halanaerobiales bacterium]|nr:TIGR00153 family protein [Halanaerobiales bacterium]